jgi:preprotein translocase subunit SecA
MMGRIGIPEDEPIENRIITRSLESAQTKIEGLHFDSRKHTLEYDDVLNYQRKIIYERRRKVLMGEGEELKSVLMKSWLLSMQMKRLKNLLKTKSKCLVSKNFIPPFAACCFKRLICIGLTIWKLWNIYARR